MVKERRHGLAIIGEGVFKKGWWLFSLTARQKRTIYIYLDDAHILNAEVIDGD